MIAHKKTQAHLLVAVIALGMGLWLGPIVIGERSSLREWFLLGAAVTGLVSASLHTWISRKSFNSGWQAARVAVARAVAEGSVVVEAEGLGEPQPATDLSTPRIVYLFLGLAWVSVLLIPIPLLLRVANAWPVNSQAKPSIVGPGDTVHIELPDSVRSIDGRWRATPTVVIENAREFGVEPTTIQATSRTGDWGVKLWTDSPSERAANLWVDLQLPEDERLAKKTVELRIEMEVAYPVLRGGNTFDDRREKFTNTLKLQTATPHAARSNLLSYIVAGGGIAGMVLAGVGLVVVSRRVERQFPDGKVDVLSKPASTGP
jgi:hypothetical protein